MATQKRKRRRRLVLAAVIVLAGIGGAAWWKFHKREVIVTVQTEKAGRRSLTEIVVANGKIQPVKQVKISPEVSGEITELAVKEGQRVNKGDLLLKIKPDFYLANRRSAEASFQSAVASRELAMANLKKAELEFKRNEGLFKEKLISESMYLDFKTGYEVAQAQAQTSGHQIDVARASLARVEEELSKTTIYAPMSGTISKLNSEPGERVVGTAMMSGTEIMIIADLNEMEARVEIGEMDVVLIERGQKAALEVDAFRDQKFSGVVTEIANSSKTANGMGSSSSSQSQEATRFEVKIRISEKEQFRPGMSVTAEVETRYRTNVITVPIQSITARLPKKKEGPGKGTNQVFAANTSVQADVSAGTNSPKKPNEPPKPLEVVFVRRGDTVKMVPVKRGISDENYSEVIEGLAEGDEVISGGYKAISRDLDDGKKIKIGKPDAQPAGKKDKERP